MRELVNEIFALRGEIVTLQEEKPTNKLWLAVCARSIEPPGPMRPRDGEPRAEHAVIAACQEYQDGWQWVSLSQPTKQIIGDLLFDNGFAFDKWYYLVYVPIKKKQKS